MLASQSSMANKPKKYLHIFAEGCLSFFAFLLSIFIYSSVFNLSLSSLFDNTKFWFCISNTIILIIAADYSIFSPSKQAPDFDGEEYLRTNTSSFTSPQFENSHKTVSVDSKERESRDEKLQIVVDIPRRQKKIPATEELSVRRSKSVQRDATEEEDDEFAKMTDEELKRRVEEFIERFNRQIRLGHGDDVSNTHKG